MNILESIIQGVVQGLTEFLPISSSGHLAIAQHFMGIIENNLFFNVSLHLGTLLSVVFVYHKMIFELILSFFSLPTKLFSGKKFSKSDKIAINLMVSLIPLFFLFVPIKNIKNLKTFASNLAESGNIKIVGSSLIVTGILLITSSIYSKSSNRRKFSQKKMSEMSLIDSLFVGLAQLAASIFPGLSRSGSTLSAGLFRGIKRESALDFSFIMGTPAILAASILEFKEAKELGVNIDWKTTFVGMMVSAFVGFLSIKLFKILVSNDRTWIFSVYSFLVGSLILIFGSVR